jgi:hypothetical protein
MDPGYTGMVWMTSPGRKAETAVGLGSAAGPQAARIRARAHRKRSGIIRMAASTDFQERGHKKKRSTQPNRF